MFFGQGAVVQTWIFQGNPDQFDLDAYLGTSPTQLPWLVTRYAQQIAVGDRVFIWRTKGSGEKDAGIIAEATIVAPTMPRPESADAVSFWSGNAEQAAQVLPRALLRLNRVASTREVLRREWLAQDPVLSDLPNLKMAAGTNYPVTPPQAARLYALWSRTGQDWSRDESVAGLWAYVKTLGTPVSRLPGSPVVVVSQLIGRAIPGVYNKVMNFRSIDPRDARAGLAASGAIDERVWNEFFDPAANLLREGDLEPMQKRCRHVQRSLPAGWKTRNWTTFSQGIMRALPSGQRVRVLPQRPRVCTSVTNWSLPLLASAPDIGARCQAAITLSSWRLTGCLTVKSTT